jgi:hypothetical protein
MWQYFRFLQLCRWYGPSGMCYCVIRWAVPNSEGTWAFIFKGQFNMQPHISEDLNLWIYCYVFMIVLSLGLKLELHATTKCCFLSNDNGQHSQWIKNISCCLGITPLYWLVNGHWNSGVFSLQSRAACHVDYLDVWPWKILHFLSISESVMKDVYTWWYALVCSTTQFYNRMLHFNWLSLSNTFVTLGQQFMYDTTQYLWTAIGVAPSGSHWSIHLYTKGKNSNMHKEKQCVS